jgi:hypothetical protein
MGLLFQNLTLVPPVKFSYNLLSIKIAKYTSHAVGDLFYSDPILLIPPVFKLILLTISGFVRCFVSTTKLSIYPVKWILKM